MSALQKACNLVFGATLIVGCSERNDPTASRALPTASFATAAPLISVVTDPVAKTSVVVDPTGDVSSKGNDYQDIVRVEITKVGRNFVFVMELAAPLPDNPPVPPGSDMILWELVLDTDPTTFPAGYPFTGPSYFEFVVEHRVYRPGFSDPLDPTQSPGFLMDRRPLLSGSQATITPVQLSIEGTKLTWVVDAALLGDPSTFQWVAGTDSWSASNQILKTGYINKNFFDVAPEVFNGASLANWPQ